MTLDMISGAQRLLFIVLLVIFHQLYANHVIMWTNYLYKEDQSLFDFSKYNGKDLCADNLTLCHEIAEIMKPSVNACSLRRTCEWCEDLQENVCYLRKKVYPGGLPKNRRTQWEMQIFSCQKGEEQSCRARYAWH